MTIEEMIEAIKNLPNAPKLSEVTFVENNILPENTILVSPKIMKLLKEILE